MTKKSDKSIFWMTGMIIVSEYLAFAVSAVIFWILLFASAIIVKIEINERMFDGWYFIVLIGLLALFMQAVGIRYGVYYVSSKALIQLNTVKTIIKWYAIAHLIIFSFSLLNIRLLSFMLFGASLVTGSFLIWYLFRKYNKLCEIESHKI